jgi:drug/metabolite transporter (DMT)-like permease
MTDRSRTLALAAWVSVCVFWGTTYLAIRIALESVPPGLLGGLRWTAAGAVLALGVRIAGRPLPAPAAWPGIALLGFLMTVMGNGLVIWAEQYVASGLAAVVVAMVPFWSVLIETGRGRGERLTVRTIAGLLLGFAGIVVLVLPELRIGQTGRPGFALGMFGLQLACLGWALGTSYTKHHASASDPLAASAMQMLSGGLMLTAIGSIAGEWGELAFTTRSAAAMIYLGIFGSIVGYSCYIYALLHLPVSFVSLYAYVNPVIAVVLGALLLDEPFGWRVVIASALVLAGIAIVRSSNQA